MKYTTTCDKFHAQSETNLQCPLLLSKPTKKKAILELSSSQYPLPTKKKTILEEVNSSQNPLSHVVNCLLAWKIPEDALSSPIKP